MKALHHLDSPSNSSAMAESQAARQLGRSNPAVVGDSYFLAPFAACQIKPVVKACHSSSQWLKRIRIILASLQWFSCLAVVGSSTNTCSWELIGGPDKHWPIQWRIRNWLSCQSSSSNFPCLMSSWLLCNSLYFCSLASDGCKQLSLARSSILPTQKRMRNDQINKILKPLATAATDNFFFFLTSPWLQGTRPGMWLKSCMAGTSAIGGCRWRNCSAVFLYVCRMAKKLCSEAA